MAVDISNAVAAYNQAVRQQQEPGLAPRDAAGGGFADVLRGAVNDGVASLNQAEQVSRAAAVGKADVNEVITAVSEAELTLQTVVALRDRVIQAYQEILRMPI
ncbi:MAG: flagellar hook-basal body complex protein FliE [Kiloniellales bacterium]|nr:flagellar hook-basal body complex protein FliE [Kiloniellales bacterium]